MDITTFQNSIGVFSWATVAVIGAYSLITAKPEIIEPVTGSVTYALYEENYDLVDVLDADSIEFVRDYVSLNGVSISGNYCRAVNEIRALCDDIPELREVIYQYYFTEHQKEIENNLMVIPQEVF